MKPFNFKTQKQLKYLSVFVLLAFILAFKCFSAGLVARYNSDVADRQFELEIAANAAPGEKISFGIYSFERADPRPFLRAVLALLLFISFFLILKNKLAISMLPTIVSISIVGLWLVSLYYPTQLVEDKSLTLLGKAFFIATIYDYILFLMIAVLFFWKIRILLPEFIEKLTEKEGMQ